MLLRNFIVTTIVITLYNSLGDCGNDNETETLILLHVLFRHGDRTPNLKEVYPKDPYINYTYPPWGYGQLTNEGKKKEFLIGEVLRKRYGSYLGKLEPGEVVSMTSDYNRTKQSCQLVLTGLYSSQNTWETNSGTAECTYQKKADDHILGDPIYYCPIFKHLYEDAATTAKALETYIKYKEFYDYISNNTGWISKTPEPVSEIYYLLQSQYSLGLKLPNWTDPIWPETFSIRAADQYYIYTASDRMKRVATGYLLKKIIEDSESRIENKQKIQPKLYLYSGHDFNLAFMLMRLGQFNHHIPPFGSYITFELHKIGGLYGFKIFYEDYSVPFKREPFNLEGCGTFCALNEFKKLVSKFLPLCGDCTDAADC